MGSFSFALLCDVEKLRCASKAAGGDGHRRGYRDTMDAVHCAGRYRAEARGAEMRVPDCEAWRRAARHGRFEVCGIFEMESAMVCGRSTLIRSEERVCAVCVPVSPLQKLLQSGGVQWWCGGKCGRGV